MEKTMIMTFVAMIAAGSVILGMKMDKYGRVLLWIMVSSIVGGMLILLGAPWGPNVLFGIPLLLIGVSMLQGVKGPDSSDQAKKPANAERKPVKKIWLRTCFGKRTEVIVTRTSIFLDWIPNIDVLGYIEVEVGYTDHDFSVLNVPCQDDVYLGGRASTSIQPDIDDDPPGAVNWKSGGQKVQAFLDAGGITGIISQSDDLIVQAVKAVAKDQPSLEMEKNAAAYNTPVLERITDKGSVLNSLAGLGVKLNKFQLILVAPELVRTARSKKAVETAQRETETMNTETIGILIMDRLEKIYAIPMEVGADGKKKMPKGISPDLIREVRTGIIEELALDTNKLSVIKTGGRGVSVLENDLGNGEKGEKP